MVESVTIGNVTIHAIIDVAPPPRDPESFFPDVPLEKWEPYKEEHLDANGKYQIYFTAWVLRSGAQTVLVDTGLGPGPHERFGGLQGRLMGRLLELGVSPEDISSIAFTHLHVDHVGWNLTEEGSQKSITFPRAKYIIPKDDWDHFTKPEVSQSLPSIQDNVLPLQGLSALELVTGEYTVTPEVVMFPTPGHTPGHTSILVTSRGEKACLVGDLFHSSVQVTEADWCAGADMDKDLARRTRYTLLDRLEMEGLTVAAGHLPAGRMIGKVVRLQGRRYWQVL
ncbi:MBL fold metallo-hydrolase [Chloroflexota bacterium]